MSRPVIAHSGKGGPPGAFGYESDGRLTTVPEAHDNGKVGLLSYVAARGREINFANKRATRTHQLYRKYGRKTRQGGFHMLPLPPICRVMPSKFRLRVILPVDYFRAASHLFGACLVPNQ